VLVCNDTVSGRSRLAVMLSLDEGNTWTATRYLEDRQEGSFHYPCVIQTRDGRIHVVYSSFTAEGKSMQHAEFNESWITAPAD
jgi:predicted neuraminidase